jgi:hypothetical protein
VPFVFRIIGKKKRVGILTARSEMILKENKKTLRQYGINQTIPIAVRGMEESEYVDICEHNIDWTMKKNRIRTNTIRKKLKKP